MSYILDALRKADSDRERGAVPGLYTQSVPAFSGGEGERRAPGLLLWAVIAVAVLLAGLLAWQFFGRDASPPAVQVAAPSPAPAPTPTPVPTPQPAPPPRVEPPIATAPAAPRPARVAPVAVPRPAPSAVAVAKPPAKAASAEARIYTQSELPDEIRRQLPQIVVSGSIYSATPANRFLVINGQVFHEGDKLAPELWLEQIKLKAAVLRFKGYRYGINY
jgi:general secretion pathway protein B